MFKALLIFMFFISSVLASNFKENKTFTKDELIKEMVKQLKLEKNKRLENKKRKKEFQVKNNK